MACSSFVTTLWSARQAPLPSPPERSDAAIGEGQARAGEAEHAGVGINIGLTPPSKPEHTQGFTPINLQNEYSPPALAGTSPQTTFDFNLDRQPTTTWRPDGRSFERIYDNAGKLDLIDTPSGTIDYSYFGPSPCVGCAPGSLASIGATRL